MNYEEIPQIETWFTAYDFEWDNYDEIKRNKQRANNFFKIHVDRFWIYLDLMTIITLAKTCKRAAYTAYYFNYANFKNFCKKAWEESIVDFTTFPEFTTKQLCMIRLMFQPNTLIFPNHMPRDILGHIGYDRNYVFHLSHYLRDKDALLERTYSQYSQYVNIDIHGCANITLRDPMVDIFLTFKKINTLNLNNVIFNKTTANILRTIGLRKIIMINSDVCCGAAIELAKALMESKHTLTEIHIEFKSRFNSIYQTTSFILDNIHLFTQLKTLTLSCILSYRNIKKLKKLNRARALENLNIIKMSNDYELTIDHTYSELIHLHHLQISIIERDPIFTDFEWD